MPNIKVYGVEPAQVQAMSGVLTPTLSAAIGCPADWISFFAGGGIFSCGQPLKTDVYVQVDWFSREETVQDAVAQVITDGIKAMDGMDGVETVTVVFSSLEKPNYYENGQHY
ncbi:DUF1904 family protein [Bengtsoniella intestinalis]|uniref:DUF1904 family protein n=1 Tax=Bengtsoniella intestinalis TaxID=3073143 RepID=UPI00391EE844